MMMKGDENAVSGISISCSEHRIAFAGQPPASTFCPRDKKCRGFSIWNIFCRWCSRKPNAVRQSLGSFDVDYLQSPGCGKDRGNFLMTLYIAVKFMYLANAVGQVYFMEQFVGSNCSFYGARVLADLVQGRDWQESGHFPRVTFCDLEAKKLGKNHRYAKTTLLNSSALSPPRRHFL
ncbi:unnamed protein product [Schistocephalus solidus]|uniref:Innexin n=1 Tax=Schistocephalus solidus TaxID=70667 RepID=A0A183TJ17_SCHSO|nr:unnamed protein product [Schistocephalus solidus]